MLWGQVGKNKRIEIDKFVAELFGAFARELEDCHFTFCFNRIAQKLLHKKSAGHTHFIKISSFFVAQHKTNGALEGHLFARGFENIVKNFGRGTFAFGAGDSYDQ